MYVHCHRHFFLVLEPAVIIIIIIIRVSGVETVGDPYVISWLEACTAYSGVRNLFKSD